MSLPRRRNRNLSIHSLRTGMVCSFCALGVVAPLVFFIQHPPSAQPGTPPTKTKRPEPKGNVARVMAQVPEAEPVFSLPELTEEEMDRLSADLQELCRQAPARSAALYVQDIETGLTASANPNRKFLAASLIKLPVMAACYELWEKQPKLKTNTTRDWMERMVTWSDNWSTDRLIDLVGGPEVVIRFCERRGLPHFRVRHAILNHKGRRGLNECTAREVTEFLVQLEERRLVSAESDEEMWGVLKRQKKRARIPAGLPVLAGLEVGNKTGTLGNALHDAGIVRVPGRSYAVTILLSGQRGDARGDAFCAKASRLIFERMTGYRENKTSIASG